LPKTLPNTHRPVSTSAEIALFFQLRPQFTKSGKVDFGRFAIAWNQEYVLQLARPCPSSPNDVIHSKDASQLRNFHVMADRHARARANKHMAVARSVFDCDATTQPILAQQTLGQFFPATGGPSKKARSDVVEGATPQVALLAQQAAAAAMAATGAGASGALAAAAAAAAAAVAVATVTPHPASVRVGQQGSAGAALPGPSGATTMEKGPYYCAKCWVYGSVAIFKTNPSHKGNCKHRGKEVKKRFSAQTDWKERADRSAITVVDVAEWMKADLEQMRKQQPLG
jgi:hypothetical protein